MNPIQHDGGPENLQPSRTVATWAPGTFVENIAIDSRGDIFCTAHPDTLYRVRGGAVETVARFPEPPNGVLLGQGNTLWVNAGASLTETNPNAIWRIMPGGAPEEWVRIPEATFLNGMALHPDGRVLTVDSRSGAVYAIDPARPAWSVWYRSDTLKPLEGEPGPGANGIKIQGGYAFISVTNKRLLVRVAMTEKGEAGELEVIGRNLTIDDFAIGPRGDFYLTTHPENSVVWLSADGSRRATIGGPDQGMVGATACAFGVLPGDETGLYVTTDGGVIRPYGDGLQPAKLVRLDVSQLQG